MFKKTTLENGLRIITAPMKGTNTITVLVLCGTGSDHESRELRGISHFLEHMFFKGTENRPRAIQIAEELDGIGSVYNAFTSHEITGYFVKAEKAHLAKSLDVLSDIYKHSLLAEEEIEREKQVVIEELHRDLDTPENHIWWIWERLLYKDQPAGWDTIGIEETIRSFTREQFVNYFEHQYTSANTAVVVAGNFDEASIGSDIAKRFADIRSGNPIREKPDVKEEQASPDIYLEHKKTDQTHLVVGFRGYPGLHESKYAAEVLGAILGSGMSSRMFVRIRERLGLAYTVMSAHESYSNRGFLVTYAGVDHTNVEKTIRAVLEEYKKIRDEGITPQELRRVKDQIRGRTSITLEASNAVANFVGQEEMMTGKPLTIDEIFDKIEAVAIDDISRVSREMMKPERLNLALIGPFEDKRVFEDMLNEF
ncbi:MAG: hypothetical protein A2847_00930 [Candidatus Sungbacteria bacterium RIFCSPHIGHO2_01_FULL_50_25]|uniref:Peptidase M16 n=1 Tax=Candidatus Sungbacteria bacterium RIFCSPHIGHO2_01_FULL_50_25 TaxID=1802265 RepID=A0A1G2KEH8_9BACT|nr:MAG: hypothetical protein A2847_00930 [Candidatus Sungbacteria bacterium RIFCSPHIGHO2_01_FULL_50_25]